MAKKNLFKIIGAFFSSLFNAGKKAYNKLSPEQQEALKNGTGLIAIINQHLEAAPAELLLIIQEKFPTLNAETLEAGVFAVAQSFGLTKLDSLEDAVAAIQQHLNKLEGKFWAHASHSAASLLAIVFAPPETKVSALVSLIETVYQWLVKKAI